MEESAAVISVEESSTEDDEKTSNGAEHQGAKVIAGEVIRNWQTKRRRQGLHDICYIHSFACSISHLGDNQESVWAID